MSLHTATIHAVSHRLTIILAGLRDGWTQPTDLSTSTSVAWEDQEMLDRAISVGQLFRAGVRSQTWREGYWPVRFIRNH
jgi:hypothetical protein